MANGGLALLIVGPVEGDRSRVLNKMSCAERADTGMSPLCGDD